MELTANCNLASKRKNYFGRTFSVFLALYPILCMYKAFYKFTIGDVLLILFLLLSLRKKISISKQSIVVIMFGTVAVLELMFNLMFSSVTAEYSTVSLIFRLLKFVFYMLCVFMCGKTHFNADIFCKTIVIVTITATLFLIVQYVMFYGTGKILLGRFPGLPLYLDEYSNINYELVYSYNFRPCSFFLEPASFCQYAVVALVMTLFRNVTKERELKTVSSAIIISIGILLTTAAQGILYLCLIYVVFAFKKIKNNIKTFAFIIALIAVALICYYQINVVQITVNRLLFNDTASNARLGTYHYIFEMSDIALFFGYGYGVTPNNEYLAGLAYIWYGCGLVGVLLSLGIFSTFYFNSHTSSARLICFLFLVMFVGTALFYNYMLFWYFAIIIGLSNLPSKEFA